MRPEPAGKPGALGVVGFVVGVLCERLLKSPVVAEPDLPWLAQSGHDREASVAPAAVKAVGSREAECICPKPVEPPAPGNCSASLAAAELRLPREVAFLVYRQDTLLLPALTLLCLVLLAIGYVARRCCDRPGEARSRRVRLQADVAPGERPRRVLRR